MSVVPSHFQVLTSVVRYEALGKLATLAEQISEARKLNSADTQKLIKQAKQIALWLQALDYSAYLTTDQINQIKYALVSIAGIFDFGTAPVLANVNRPAILLGGSGNTITNNNTYAGGTPFENTDVDIGTETVFSVATSLGSGAVMHYVVTNGTAYRSGQLTAVWDGSTADCNEISSPDVGGSTSDLVLDVDVSAGEFRLRATAASNNWQVFGDYFLID